MIIIPPNNWPGLNGDPRVYIGCRTHLAFAEDADEITEVYREFTERITGKYNRLMIPHTQSYTNTNTHTHRQTQTHTHIHTVYKHGRDGRC